MRGRKNINPHEAKRDLDYLYGVDCPGDYPLDKDFRETYYASAIERFYGMSVERLKELIGYVEPEREAVPG